MGLQPVTPEGWKRGRGYSHAINVDGRVVVAGVLPWNPATQEIEVDDFAGQWGVALRNLRDVVAAAGSSADQVISLRVYVTSLEQYNAASADLGEAWSEVFGRHFPAITLVEVSGLVEPGALIEIEAEASAGGDG